MFRERWVGVLRRAMRAAPTARTLRAEDEGATEAALRAHLRQDPNDVAAFAALADIVRRRAQPSGPAGYPRRTRRLGDGSADAVWALAEELAHSSKAWFPLVEMARLSIDEDREGAMRRLGTAAERDPTGEALAQGLAMLRRAGHHADALNLGMGHWRPREHRVEVGQQLVEAAVEAGRAGEARRHLAALAARSDAADFAPMLADLEDLVSRVDTMRMLDLREDRGGQAQGHGPRRRRSR
jgi:hypothetical protein